LGQDVDLVNRWRFSQQYGRFFHQRRGDLAIEMRIAAGLVIESVENRKRGRAFLNCKPAYGAGFSIYQRQRRLQEFRNFLFFAASRGTYRATFDIAYSHIAVDADTARKSGVSRSTTDRQSQFRLIRFAGVTFFGVSVQRPRDADATEHGRVATTLGNKDQPFIGVNLSLTESADLRTWNAAEPDSRAGSRKEKPTA